MSIGFGKLASMGWRLPLLTGLAAVLAACADRAPLTPSPGPVTPPRYRNASPEADSNLPQKWWLVYHDASLSELIETTLRDNPYSDIALMRVAEARAQVQVAAADRLPYVGAEAAAKNSHSSVNTPLGRLLGGLR
jgi:outer membrane protein TolC